MKIILLFVTTVATMGLTTFANAQTLPSYLPTNGLVAWYPFNGNANDESGNGNHGVVNGATLTADRNGNMNSAYDFDGISNSIVSPVSIDLGLEHTLSMWVRFNDINSPQYIFNTVPHTGYAVVLNYLCCGTDRPGAITYCIGNSSTWSVTCPDSYFNYSNPNEWKNLIVTYSNNYWKFYLNGQLVSEFNYIGNYSSTSPSNFVFGSGYYSNAYQELMNGQLDDIAIYNRALTQEEITALYTATATNGGGGNNTASTNFPQGISYQAVARNAQGQPLSNTALQVKFTLLADSLTGTAEYSELHFLTTNDLGLFTTAFGTGTPLSGTFANINWAGGNKFVKIEADQGGGFIEMGTQQMLSVPYSMRSQTSAAILNNALPVYSNNAAALAGGLQAGQMYRTATGDLKIVY